MNNQIKKSTLMIFSAGIVQAQSVPSVRIILPERFRALTHQYFDVRIEAENLTSPTAR